MDNKQPTQQVDDEQPSRRPEHSDTWDRTMFIIRRNMRQLIGFLLVCVVGGIIYYVATKPKEPKSSGAWRQKLGGAETSDSNGGGATDGSLGSQGSFNSDSDGQSDQNDSGLTSTEPAPKRRSSNSEDNAQTLEEFLETASTSELVEELLRLRGKNSSSLPVNFVIVQRRSRVAKHLLETKISEDQKLFATTEYIESAIQLDAINMNMTGNLNAGHVRDELIAIRDKFSDHTDPAIGAKASLVHVLLPLHDHFKNKDAAEFEKTADLFDLHADEITRHPDTAARFAKLSVDLFVQSDFADPQRELATRLMKRMEKDDNPQIKEIARLLREQIYFAKSELGTLVERIEGGNTIARDDVQYLFEGLDANPTSRLAIYKIATNVIVEYDKLGHKEDAQALLKWLIAINAKNSSEKDQTEISAAIAEFQSRKTSDDPIETISPTKE